MNAPLPEVRQYMVLAILQTSAFLGKYVQQDGVVIIS